MYPITNFGNLSHISLAFTFSVFLFFSNFEHQIIAKMKAQIPINTSMKTLKRTEEQKKLKQEKYGTGFQSLLSDMFLRLSFFF